MKINLTLASLLLALSAFAQVDPKDKSGVAIGGFDVVAYFKDRAAKKGSADFVSTHEGITYWFSTSQNQRQFISDPLKYIPQYDGYCALAVSYGKKISIDPETFKIIDDKLYLFYHGKSSLGKVNSLDTWNKNEEKLLKKANVNWPEVKNLKYKPEDRL